MDRLQMNWCGTELCNFFSKTTICAHTGIGMGRQTVGKPNRNTKINIFVEKINNRMRLFLNAKKLHLTYVKQPLFFWVKPFFVQFLCWCGFFSIHNQCTTKTVVASDKYRYECFGDFPTWIWWKWKEIWFWNGLNEQCRMIREDENNA